MWGQPPSAVPAERSSAGFSLTAAAELRSAGTAEGGCPHIRFHWPWAATA